MGPSAHFSMAALISSALASLPRTAVRSTIDTSGVGTRRAIPFIFPFSDGITLPIAFAAPVVVGTIESAADLPRRRSLWVWSRMLWSLV